MVDVLNKLIECSGDISLENTYIGEDGLHYCKTCGSCKEYRLKDSEGNVISIVKCVCKCDEEEDKQHKERLKLQNNMSKQYYIEDGYRNHFFEDSDTELKECINYVKNFEYFYDQGIGLMLFGSIGSGKTFAAICIANELCRKGKTVAMLHVNNAISKMTRFGESQSFMELIYDCDLLILDDFGADGKSDNDKKQLISIIDTRYNSGKPIIITTNMERKDLDIIDNVELGRVYNRLIEMTHPVKFESNGRRKEKSKLRFQEIDKMLKG